MKAFLAKQYSPLQLGLTWASFGAAAHFENPFLLLIALAAFLIPTYTGISREEMIAAAMLCDPDLHEVNSCPTKILERVSEKNANYERNTRGK